MDPSEKIELHATYKGNENEAPVEIIPLVTSQVSQDAKKGTKSDRRRSSVMVDAARSGRQLTLIVCAT